MDRSWSSCASSSRLRAPAEAALLLAHAPLAYLALWLRLKSLFAAALLGLLLAALLAPAARRRFPRLYAIWAAIYYLGALTGQLLPAFFLALIWGWRALALPVLALAIVATARRRIPALLAGLALAALALWLAAPLRLEQLAVVAALVAAGLALGLLGAFAQVPRRSLGMAACGALSALGLISFLAGVPLWRTDDVLAQPGIKPLYLAADRESPLYELIGRKSEPRFALITPDGRRALIGVRGARPGIVVSELGNPRSSRRLPFAGDCSDNAVWDARSNRLFAADYGAAKLYSYALDDPRQPLVVADASAKLPGLWRIGADGATLLLLHDATSEVYSIDPQTLAVRQAARVGWNAALALDEPRNAAWHMSNTGALTELDLTTLAAGRQARFEGFTYFNLALDPAEPALYVASMSSGVLNVLDPATLKLKRAARIGPGIRQLELLPNGKLAVADFLHGTLLIVDCRTLQVLRRIETGPRPRWPALDSTGRRLSFTSGLGAFVLELDSLEPNPKK